MKITVIGCGRWGSLIAWYLDSIKQEVTLYGRKSSKHMQRFMLERKNDVISLPASIKLSNDLDAINEAEIVIISVNSQGFQALMDELKIYKPKNKVFVLCMKGIEIATERRLSQVAKDNLDASNKVAVWLGPGHVQELANGIPNCMVIDSDDEETKNNYKTEMYKLRK